MANCPKSLAEWRKRLKNVIIENEPWQSIIDKYQSDDTFFVLDPPYMPNVLCTASKKYYQHNFSTEDHIRLLNAVHHIKGNVLLLGYNHPAYLRRLWHWRQKSFPVKKALTGMRSAREEQAWLNYDAAGNRMIENLLWMTKQFLALAGWSDYEEAGLLLALLEEITRLAKGANGTLRPANEPASFRDGTTWLAYTNSGSKLLDNRLWIGKRFVEAVGGFEEAHRMLNAACPE